MTARQPAMLVWVLLACTTAWLPTVLTRILMQSDRFVAFADSNRITYFTSFFIFQISLVCGVALFLGCRYKSALWTPQPDFKKILFPVAILTPLFALHCSTIISVFPTLLELANVSKTQAGREMIAIVHQKIWGGLAYGPSPTGVVCFFWLTIIFPVVEETLFSGFLANRLAARFGTCAALLFTPLLFTVGHVPQYGPGINVIHLYLAGLTYVAIRFQSGSLILSVISHMLVNAVIMVPKLWIAMIRFS
jgi:membrane protease YdiL (CAAX protease family)